MNQTRAAMGTLVSIATVPDEPHVPDAVARALAWFDEVERVCSRFEPESELSRLCRTLGRDVPVTPLLFEALHAALAVAEASGGAFDPTLGARLEAAGYNRHHRTGAQVATRGPAPVNSRLPVDAATTYRDLRLDPSRNTVRLERPLLLDLGAVAKGLAVDLAARELAPVVDFAIDAGGDLYLGGHNHAGGPWQVGLRHPRLPDAIFETVAVSNAAICTSGDYERGGHILDPRDHHAPAKRAISASVIAPSAMAADALATAAMVLGPVDGLALLQRESVAGLIIAPGLERHATPDWPGNLAEHQAGRAAKPRGAPRQST